MDTRPVRAWCLCLSLLLAALLIPTAAAAQEGAVSGIVTDVESGIGLSTVEVEVLRADGSSVAGTLTARNGVYRLAGIPAGTYSVSFMLAGWELQVETDVVVTAGQTTNLSAALGQRSFNLNPITVTASRRVEKALEAPAAVEVVTREDIAERPATTPVEYVKEKAGVDFVGTGLQQNYVVVRGFNNIFSGATLNLTDYRISRVPSLRVNVSHLNPTTTADIDRVEVLLGPGSALYGPNAANGVIHYLTQSPIDNPGMEIAVSSGLRQQGAFSQKAILNPRTPSDSVTFRQNSSDEWTWQLEGRVAWKTADDKFGIKLSGQYFTGQDYGYIDPDEKTQQAIAIGCQQASYNPTTAACFNFAGDLNFGTDPAGALTKLRTRVDNVAGPKDPTTGTGSIGTPESAGVFLDNTARDNDLERWALDLRADLRPSPETSLVLSGGRTTALNSVDLTGIGGGQVKDWKYYYAQGRFQWKKLFAQLFWNKSDNNETYLLRSGRPLVDKSYQIVGQLQHGAALSEAHSLTYGVDVLYTRPQSDSTINGRHEADDDVTEYGAYVQYDGRFTDQWNLVLAARFDDHSRLEDPVFSPRAALIFKPTPERSLRVSYNRAFSTPNTLNYFLDISAQAVPLFGPFFYDVRAQGVTESGFQFNRDGGGIPQHMSPFNLLNQRAFTPTNSAALWGEALTAFGAITQGTCQQAPTSPDCAGLTAAFQAFAQTAAPPDGVVPIVAATLNPETRTFFGATTDLASISNVPTLKPTIWQTFEFGYKGLLLGSNLLLGGNVYYTQVDDFVSALEPFTPNVFLNGQALAGYLISQNVPLPLASLIASTVGSAQTEAGLVGLPLGVITPGTAGGATAAPILFTYRNLGDFDFFGADASLSYVLNDRWEVSGSVSWVEKNTFLTGDEEDPATREVALNAPKWKGAATVGYREPGSGWRGAVRGRFVDGFPVASGVYIGEVDSYAVFDLNVGYAFPGRSGLTLQLDIQNIFDNSYQSFVGVPEFGRYSVVRLIWRM